MVIAVHNQIGMWIGVMEKEHLFESDLIPVSIQLNKPAQVILVTFQKASPLKNQVVMESNFMVLRLPTERMVISIETPAFYYEVIQNSGVYQKYMEIIDAEIEQASIQVQ